MCDLSMAFDEQRVSLIGETEPPRGSGSVEYFVGNLRMLNIGRILGIVACVGPEARGFDFGVSSTLELPALIRTCKSRNFSPRSLLNQNLRQTHRRNYFSAVPLREKNYEMRY